jgi:hypothetical protein
MKKIALTVIAALISGCAATPAAQPLPAIVKIPVAVPCIKPEDVPVKPAYESLTDNNNTSDETVILHVTRDFVKSLPYQAQLEAVIVACR